MSKTHIINESRYQALLRNPYNAWVHLAPFEVLRDQFLRSQQRMADNTPYSNLDGWTFSAKDTQHVAGMPTSFGSVAYETDWPKSSSPVIELAESLGAMCVGKTATCEFAWKATTESPAHGITFNPVDALISPGGSSGGAAATVANGDVDFAFGTDAGGSVRIPAILCGQVGFKPTHKRAASASAVPGFREIGQWGLLAKSVPIIKSVWSEIEIRTNSNTFSLIKKVARNYSNISDLRVGVLSTSTLEFSRTQAAEWELLRQRLFTLLRPMKQFELDWKSAMQAHRLLYQRGVYETLQKITHERRAMVDPGLLAMARNGAGINDQRYEDALEVRSKIQDILQSWFHDVDTHPKLTHCFHSILTPTNSSIKPC